MKSTARTVVIGGGVVGCSVLYHLTKLGWSDVVLIERSELTSGSTWHAAGGFHTLNADPNMAALQGYTIRLYRELEELTGLSCGLHHVGGLTIATTPRPARLPQGRARQAPLHGARHRDRRTRGDPPPLADHQHRRRASARSTTRSTAISTPPARPMPMPRRPASAAPRSCCGTASPQLNQTARRPGTW